jgi:hypothetical protein
VFYVCLLKSPNLFVRCELASAARTLCVNDVVLLVLLSALRACVKSRVEQIHVLERSRRARLRLAPADRVFWVWLSRVWTGWQRPLIIVRPATVIASHRQGFRWFWRWKSRARTGRPRVPADVRALIRVSLLKTSLASFRTAAW